MRRCSRLPSALDLMPAAFSLSPTITIVDEPCYSFSSADNSRRYGREYLLERQHRTSSVHGVLLNEVPLAVFGAAGGCSGVHAHCALIHSGRLYIAVGDHLACFDLERKELAWATKVDEVTCFGVYYHQREEAIFCHGELAVCRLDLQGNVVWSESGADIFTGEFSLGAAGVYVTDFNGRKYSLSLVGGNEI